MNTLGKFYLLPKDRKGSTMAEYAVIAAVLILIAIVAFTNLGSSIVITITSLVGGMG